MTRRRTRIRCAPGTAERTIQAAVGVLLAAFALDSLADPLVAILAALGAALLVVGAIRGWCPGGLLAARLAANESAADESEASELRAGEPGDR